MKRMAANSPHHRTVITRVLSIWRAAVKRHSAYAAHIISSVPGPASYRMPVLDLDLKRHVGGDRSAKMNLSSIPRAHCAVQHNASGHGRPIRCWGSMPGATCHGLGLGNCKHVGFAIAQHGLPNTVNTCMRCYTIASTKRVKV